MRLYSTVRLLTSLLLDVLWVKVVLTLYDYEILVFICDNMFLGETSSHRPIYRNTLTLLTVCFSKELIFYFYILMMPWTFSSSIWDDTMNVVNICVAIWLFLGKMVDLAGDISFWSMAGFFLTDLNKVKSISLRRVNGTLHSNFLSLPPHNSSPPPLSFLHYWQHLYWFKRGWDW